MKNEEVLKRLTQPEWFKPWIEAYNRVPYWTGMLVYCGHGRVDFNERGHFVAKNQIAAGYAGKYICKQCSEELYGEHERAAQAKLAERAASNPSNV